DELHLSRGLDGRVELRGSFSAHSGAAVHAVLEGELDRRLRARRDDDPAAGRTASEERAHVLVDLLSGHLRREPSHASVPDRYRVGVVVRWDELDSIADAACDSLLYRIVVGARGEVLDVGRHTSTWPVGIRRAITYRDGGCVFPGCDRPPAGATSITAPNGTTTAPPASTTAPSCADATTPSSPAGDG